MLQSLFTRLVAATIVAVCGYGLYAGGWRERCGAGIYLLAYLATLGFGLISIEYTTLYLLVVDTLCLQVFYVLSWKSPNSWPKWAVAGQLLSVAMEILTLLHIGFHSRSFLIAENLVGLAVLMALLLGTIAAAQAKRDARRLALQK